MAQEQVRIASFGSEIEAGHYGSLLRERGIAAFVEGGATGTVFAGNSAITRIWLTTSSEHANAAIDILEAAHDADSNGTPWYCDDCDETIEAGFQVCWSCGKDRPDQASAPSIATVVKESPSKESLIDKDYQEDEATRDLSNPYAAPAASEADASESIQADRNADAADDEVVEPLQEEAEQNILRAFRAAWIGFLLFPFVAHLYSLYLLARTTSAKDQLASRWQRLWNWAFVIDIVAIGFWVVWIRWVASF